MSLCRFQMVELQMLEADACGWTSSVDKQVNISAVQLRNVRTFHSSCESLFTTWSLHTQKHKKAAFLVGFFCFFLIANRRLVVSQSSSRDGLTTTLYLPFIWVSLLSISQSQCTCSWKHVMGLLRIWWPSYWSQSSNTEECVWVFQQRLYSWVL